MLSAGQGRPAPVAAVSDNAGGWAKFGRPKNACVFEGGRIWSSPHGRARLRAQLARARPEEPPQSGGDVAPIRVLSEGRPASCLNYQNIK